jgi:hypothetical protein
LWRELRDILVGEDVELRYSVTTQGAEATVMDVGVHFRVSDLEAALSAVRWLYAASGLSHPASVCVYGPDSGVVATHLIADGEQRHAEPSAAADPARPIVPGDHGAPGGPGR